MRVLFINSIWPHPSHSTRAANIVLFELLREFAQTPGLELGFLKLSNPETSPATVVEREAAESLQQYGVTILEECRLPPSAATFSTRQQLMSPRLVQFYPEIVNRETAIDAAEVFDPDALVILWSEMATALFATMPVRKYAYYGNPDHKSFMARVNYERRHGGDLKRYILNSLRGHHLERMHLGVMREYECIGDVAQNDALYYRRRGLKQASYIQNIWIDRFPDAPKALSGDVDRNENVVRIIANVGKLGGTANTHGLEYLSLEVLPHLPAAMNGQSYEVHILGSGELHPSLAKTLPSQPGVKMRGFVDDIDDEMASSGIFLCVNNGTAYNVGHTRYLHAWSLGCCVIAHTAVREAMPEFQAEKNALLGCNGKEIAALVARAAGDRALRERLGRAGYATFREQFTSRQVASRIVDALSK